MRIHRLEVVAFGPFAERVSVDLDTLSDAGLFLLTGATGAGKTSVLDAVCFALYGAVPGDRQGAKRLRSDHAAPGVAPEVTMEFTVAGRRFLIVRSPAWTRPKRRGTGTTPEQARVTVSERIDGTWRALSTRLDETGHLVSGLLGMNLTQFCQVQMLPQGRFQAFLRADSGERHELLQRLFRTSRFVAVESWLRDRRRALRRTAGERHDVVAGLVGRVSEAAAAPLPPAWDLHALAPTAGELLPWVDQVVDDVDGSLRAARQQVAEAEARASLALQVLEAGRRNHEQRERLRRARADHEALHADRAAHEERLTRLDAARRAAAVRPFLQEVARTQEVCQQAAAVAEAALAEVTAGVGSDELDESQLAAHQRSSAARLADAQARLPLSDEHDRLVTAVDADRRALSCLADDLDALEGEAARLPDELSALRADEADVRRAVDGLPDARRAVEEAAVRHAAAVRTVELLAERELAVERRRGAVDHALALKERWLDVQERRLTGMAAEIAGSLALGACCPVCGSAEHPHPATPSPDAPDRAAERAARKDLDDAEVERLACEEVVRDLDTELARARERSAGGTVPDLEAALVAARSQADRLAIRAEELDATVAAREAAEARLERTTARRTGLLARQAALQAATAERSRRLATINEELERQLDGTGAPTLGVLVEELTVLDAACRRGLHALDERTRAERDAAEARLRAEEAATAQGFAALAEAEAADLPEAEVTELDRLTRDREQHMATLAAVLHDDDLLRAEAEPAADPDALEAAHAEAAEELTRSRTTAARAEERDARLRRLHGELARAVAAWTPVCDELELADRVATLVDGTSPDNRLRMRLSGYVLAFRLRQVVAAANERLVGMTDGRYRLEHTGDRGAGETRGGLSLRVRDDWTGEARDPVTLSGGETFVVSLALALGLADVITHEAGGSELDTLFVDEGFGSLDADTLDDVMDMLDGLRDGGRVVGVVSHVAELRDRIPAQLHVRKARSGSTLRLGGVG